MNKKQQELTKVILVKGLYKIVDKLEKRIATLEKVSGSHAKCIGEMQEVDFFREEKPCPTKK